MFLAADGRRLDQHGGGRIVRRAGIGKTVTPHTLRHAFITAALDAGRVPLRDEQEAASHADPRTTMRYDRAPTARGPHLAVAISESLVDGIIAVFHDGASAAGAAAVTTALAPRLPGMTETEIAALAAVHSPRPLFAGSPFVIKSSYVQISPCDERCQAGQVTLGPGAEGPFMQISGELFTLAKERTLTGRYGNAAIR